LRLLQALFGPRVETRFVTTISMIVAIALVSLIVVATAELQRATGVALEDQARRHVRERVRRFRRRRGLLRAAGAQCRRDHASGADIADVTRRLNERFLAYFAPHRAEIRHPDPDAAILRGLYFLAAVCRDRILYPGSPHAASVPMRSSELEDELTRLLVGYLRGGSG